MTDKKKPKNKAVAILSDGLVELSVSQPEFDPSENTFTVAGFVACQPKQVHKTANAVFIVSVKQVLLKESCFGCKPIPGSFFQEITQAGKLERVSKNEESTGRSAKISGSASGQSSIVGSVKAAISGGVEGSRDFQNKNNEKSETFLEIARVRRIAGGWRIGELNGGDPIRGNLLDGVYMADRPWAKYRLDKIGDRCRINYKVALPLNMINFHRELINKNFVEKTNIKEKIFDIIGKNRSPKEILKNYLSSIALRKYLESNSDIFSVFEQEYIISDVTIKIK